MVDEGQLKWTDPVFRFEGDQDVQVLHAGGLYNAFGRDDLTKEEKEEMKAAKIFVGGDKGAWRENAQAKMSYLFVVVDNANPSAGPQVAIEPNLLGDKVKGVISDTLAQWEDSDTPEVGDPFKKPYCIQWEYRAEEQEFGKKYHAVPLPNVKLTGEVVKALRAPPPDTGESTAPFNKTSMRATLERHCLVKNIPWDEVFDVETGPRESEDEEAEYVDPDADAPAPAAEEEVEAPKPKPKGHGKGEKDKAPPPPPASSTQAVSVSDADEDDDGLIECDACHEGIPEDAPEKCPHCGQEYDAAGHMVAKKPGAPPATKKRGKNVGTEKAPF